MRFDISKLQFFGVWAQQVFFRVYYILEEQLFGWTFNNFWGELLANFSSNFWQLLGQTFSNFWIEILATFGSNFLQLLGRTFSNFWVELLASFWANIEQLLAKFGSNLEPRKLFVVY